MKRKRGMTIVLLLVLMLNLFQSVAYAEENISYPEVIGFDASSKSELDSQLLNSQEEDSIEEELNNGLAEKADDSANLQESELGSAAEELEKFEEERVIGSIPETKADLTDSKSDIRYNVLILDTSGSMEGTPEEVQRQAAKKFCEAITKAEGINYVAIVELNSDAYVAREFTNDLEELENTIFSMGACGGTNINSALIISEELLDSVKQAHPNAITNIILCSDGLPESGDEDYDGPYSEEDNSYSYSYANAAYATADEIKRNGYTIYTLGFFHSLEGEDLEFGRRFMTDISNGIDSYYEVSNVDELEFAFGEVADDIVTDNALKELMFTYQSGNDYCATCYYSNNYFAKSAYEYNPSLATMSICYAMSAFGSSKESSYENKSINAVNLLKDIGFPEENIKTNSWFKVKPTTDSIAAIAGSKKVKFADEEFTLIALAVRGGGYEREWSSNFTIGTAGQHEGFNEAKNNIISFLQDYVSSLNITGNVKFWITGYSRAAATANLVGGAIDSGTIIGSELSYTNDDVYVYTFETPAGALTSEVKFNPTYNNIFNILNLSDPVPYVAPAAMGFGRYGVDRYLPSAASTATTYDSKKDAMLKVFNSLESTDTYIVDDFQMKKIQLKNWLPFGKKISYVQDDKDNPFSQGVFLSNYVTILSKEFIKSRSNYVATYQEEIREILSVVFGCTDEQARIMIESIASQAKDNKGELIKSYIWNVGLGQGKEEDALQIVSDWLKKAIDTAGIKDIDEEKINQAGIYLSDLALALAVTHPNYLATAAMNGSGLAAAHYPELAYAWLTSMDPNYSAEAKTSFNNY